MPPTSFILSRGRAAVVLVGQKKAIAVAVRNVSGRRRWSKRQDWLQPSSGKFSLRYEMKFIHG
jgi:hypothetical protein